MPSPATINISMPATMARFVKDRSAQLGCGNTSEYFRHLVREDQKRADEDRLESLLLEGLASGRPVQMDEKWWAQRHAKLTARLNQRKTA